MSFRFASLLVAALALTGCGKHATPTSAALSPEGVVKQVRSVVTTANSFDEQQFWNDYPTQIVWVTIKSQKTDYMVVQMNATRLGFNDGAKLFFPVTVQGKVQFQSNLFLGRDKGLYIAENANGAYNFYRVGTFGDRAMDVSEGDAVKVRMDPNILINAGVAESTSGGTPTLNASVDLHAMPAASTHVNLYTRASN